MDGFSRRGWPTRRDVGGVAGGTPRSTLRAVAFEDGYLGGGASETRPAPIEPGECQRICHLCSDEPTVDVPPRCSMETRAERQMERRGKMFK